MTASKKLIQAAAGAGGGAFYPYTVDNSCRFNGSSDVLYRTNDVADDATRGAISIWAKRSKLTSDQILYSTWGNGYIYFQANDTINIYDSTSGMQLITTAVYRDISAWYHILLLLDSNNATASDRQKLYINGIRVTDFSTENTATSASNFYIFGNVTTNDVNIGRYASAQNLHFGGYVAQACRTDGTHYSSETDFGEFKNGVWIPKDLSGLTFGTAGWLLDFADSANLGNDVSGNNNDFTSSGLTSSDQMIDTPTNNFPTWNPLFNNGNPVSTLSNGNLYASHPGSGDGRVPCTIALPDAGKWYMEMRITMSGAIPVGYSGLSDTAYLNTGTGKYVLWYANDGIVYYDGGTLSVGTYASGDILGIMVDLDSSAIKFYKNGALLNTLSSYDASGMFFTAKDGTNSLSYLAQTEANFGQGGTYSAGYTDANGVGDFYYTVPTDALALCTANLPEPTLGPNSDENVTDYFKPVLYTGNGTAIGSGGKAVTGVGFQSDFTWIKNRDAADSHMLFDAVRGVTKYLESDTTDAEATDTESLSTFDTDGFTLGNNVAVNTNTEDYVAWNWKANGAGSSNTDGSITSTVSVNTTAGISIATFTMPSSGSFTVGHGLGVAPKMFILTRTSSTSSWGVWHTGLSGGTYYVLLDTTGAQVNDSTVWTSAPTSTLLNIGSAWPSGGQTAVAYSFAEVEGFSAFGSYPGNGSADGPFVYTGFRPAYVIFKRTDSTSSWNTHDASRSPYNVSDDILWADLADAETTGSSTGKLDFLSNGVKIRGTANGINTSSGTYIYMAFAENPFKYANAR